MEALDNAKYGSQRPLTNLRQIFRVCHLYTFNVAAILGGVIPIYGTMIATKICALCTTQEIFLRKKAGCNIT